MDNCSTHHIHTRSYKHNYRDKCYFTFLPPYSPDYNPIGSEEVFSKVKIAVKSKETEMQALDDIVTII